MNGQGVGFRSAGLVLTITAIAAVIGIVLHQQPPTPSAGLVVFGGIALTAVLALAIIRYERAALLGFALLGVILVEPAPPDFVLIIVIAVAAVTGRIVLARVRPVIFVLLSTFVALNLISMVEIINVSRGFLFLTITLYMIVLAVWVCSFVNSPRRARLLVIGYLIAAVSSAAIVLLAYITTIPFESTVIYIDGRAKGFFLDANVFGPFLVPAIAILLQEILEPRLLRLRPSVKLLMVAVMLAGVLFSYSRGAWINATVAIVIVLLVTAIRRGGARRAGRMLALILVLGGSVLAIFAAVGSVQFLNERAGPQTYDTERFGAQRTGISLAGQNPIGIGPGQFEEVSPLSTHSIYVRVLSEQGVLGFMTLIALLLVTLLLATQNALRGRSTYGIGSAALLGAWAGILVNSAVIDTAHWRHLWIVAALIWVGSMPYSRPGGGGSTGARNSDTTKTRPVPR